MRRLRTLLLSAVCVAMLAPPASAAATAQIQGAAFTSASDGYLGVYTKDSASSPSRGVVAKTADGGYTWRSTRLASPGVVALDAGGAGVWSVAAFSRYLWRSADAAASWTRSTAALPSDARPTSVLRVSGSRTVVAGSHGGVVASDGRPHGRVAFVATTEDNGATWARRYEGPLYFASGDSDLDPPTEAAFAAVVSDPTGTTLWAVGNEWQRGGASLTYKQRLVLKSTDGGTTWSPAGTLPKHSPQRIMTAATAPAAGTLYVFGENRQYLKTSDGGATWSALMLPALSGAREVNVRAAAARDTSRLVVVGDMKKTVTGPLTGVIAYSADGGATWTYRELPDVPSLRTVTMLSDTHWFVAGGNEVLLHTTDAGATWTGQRGMVAPSLALSSPSNGFGLSTSMPVPLSGTATDTGIGLAGVDVSIRRADGKYWNGVAWGSAQAWLPATTTNGWQTWTFAWTPDAATVAARTAVSMSVAAVDGCGNRSALRSVSSVGKTAASVGTPGGVPSTAVRNRTYTVSGTLSPRHPVGSRVVRVAAQRLERKSNGRLAWTTRKTVSATIGSDFKYRARLALPSTGKWRLYAYHPSDAAHITSFSGYRSVTVR